MSVDSNALFSTTSCIPTTTTHANRTLGSTDNLKGFIVISTTKNTKYIFCIDNRGYITNPDDTLTSVLTTLAGTIKDITESPYFPKMAFKRIPSSKNNGFHSLHLSMICIF